MKFDNTLHLGPGPLITLDGAPAADEPVVVALRGCTLRDAVAALEFRFPQPPTRQGEIAVHADRCVLAPSAAGALLLLSAGGQPPTGVLRTFVWSGQDSVLDRAAEVAVWRDAEARLRVWNPREASFAGLVRSGLEFAGGAAGEAAQLPARAVASSVARR